MRALGGHRSRTDAASEPLDRGFHDHPTAFHLHNATVSTPLYFFPNSAHVAIDRTTYFIRAPWTVRNSLQQTCLTRLKILCKSLLISAIDTAYMKRISELTLLPEDSIATHFNRLISRSELVPSSALTRRQPAA